MSTKCGPRIAYIDVARALGLLAIIMYHSLPPKALGDILLSYAIGLFFIISGFLYKDAYSKTPFQYVRRRFVRLYVPYVGWGLFYLALHNVFFRLRLYSDVTGFQGVPASFLHWTDFGYKALRILAFSGLEQMGGALWFLPTLFFAEVMFVTISWGAVRFTGRFAEYVRFGAVAAVFLVGYFNFLSVQNPWIGGRELVAVGIVYLGYAIRRVEPGLVWRWYVALAGALVLVLAGPAVDFAANKYSGPVQLLAVTAAGAYVNFYAARHAERIRLLNYIGRNTIFLLATHFLAFKLVSLVIVALYDLPLWHLSQSAIPLGQWWIVYFAVGVSVPLGVKLAIDRAASVFRSSRATEPVSAAEG